MQQAVKLQDQLCCARADPKGSLTLAKTREADGVNRSKSHLALTAFAIKANKDLTVLMSTVRTLGEMMCGR